MFPTQYYRRCADCVERPFLNSQATVYADNSLSVPSYSYNPATRSSTGGTDAGFPSVNAALDNVLSGGTVYVRAGTYQELHQTDRCYNIVRPVTIQAYNGETAILTYPPGNPPLTAAGEYGYIIKHNNNVILDGLTIIGTYDEGDSVSQDTDVSVSIGTSGHGIIKNCTFQKWGHAAIKYGVIAGTVTIENNVFQAGGFTTRDHHIYISGGDTTLISGNSFAGATGWGVHLYSYANNVTVTGNTITANYGGIVVTGEGHIIDGNTITDNIGGNGIYFFHYGLSNLTVTDNIMSGNTNYDMKLDASVGEGFTNCTFSGNTGSKNW